MPASRIAVLFDAENAGADIVPPVLAQIRSIGAIHSCRAIGDFTSPSVSGWISQARAHGIELILQPSLGKGKNSADILLAVEAMDLAHRGGMDAFALVSSDRDFTPLALRLRHRGFAVFGYGRAETSADFRAACTQFSTIVPVPAVVAAPVPIVQQIMALSVAEQARLSQIVHEVCDETDGVTLPAKIAKVLALEAPELSAKVKGKGKFLRTLVALGLVERVGSGPNTKVRAAGWRKAS